jgi:hypothetical protein
MLEFLRTRRWVTGRRIILILIILFLAYRNYGDRIGSWTDDANDAQRDIVITRAEFHASAPGERPAWIITFRNSSSENTYDQIELDAVYSDAAGRVLQRDKLVVKQVLGPLEEKQVASMDSRERGAAVNGTITVVNAKIVE